MSDDLRGYARSAASAAGIDPETFVRQIQQESGFNPSAYNPGSGASGVAQIVPRWHPDVDPWNPFASLDYAARWMAQLVHQFDNQYYKALAAYNWGPGNVASWDGRPQNLPAETRRYLDVILGPGWLNPPEVKPVRLSEVLERGRSRVGDPYVWAGKAPGGFDCSGFVAWCYDGQLPAFTDAIYDVVYEVEDPAPGDIVLYEYADPSQPGVRFPHVGLYLDDATTLDARGGGGVGVHPHLPPSQAALFYGRAFNAVADTGPGAPEPSTEPTHDEKISGYLTAIAHLADVVLPRAAGAAAERDAALAEGLAIREQFVGPRPA